MSHGPDLAAVRPRLVGLNHVALEVGNVEEALAFYGRIFSFTLRGRQPQAAFIDLGDQFIALMEGPLRAERGHRHFGLVVADRSAVRTLAAEAGAELLDGPFLDFLDPWGNRIEIVDYSDIQFTKAPHVLRGMGLELSKTIRRNGSWPKKEWAQRRNTLVPEWRTGSPPTARIPPAGAQVISIDREPELEPRADSS
jgi:catechol 2,3-dioxygenase-like lactoylglutathione lyase family enzyme